MEIRLGTILIQDGNSHINLHDELTINEYEIFKAHIAEIRNVKDNERLRNIVVLNHRAFFTYVDEILDEFGKTLTVGVKKNDNDESYILNINRHFLNYLSSVRTFIDHSRTCISRKFGKDSSELSNLKQFISSFYDNSFAYRFFYKLRNYSQHCELPLQEIIFSTKINDAQTLMSGELTINFDPEKLLKSYTEWGKVKSDLEKMQTNPSVANLIIENTIVIEKIWMQINSLNAQKVGEAAKFIKGKTKHLRNENTTVYIFNNIRDNEKHELKSFSMERIPMDIIDLLVV